MLEPINGHRKQIQVEVCLILGLHIQAMRHELGQPHTEEHKPTLAREQTGEQMVLAGAKEYAT